MDDPVVVVMPNLVDGDPATIRQVLVRIGQRVRVGEPLLSVETDKADREIPSPTEGSIMAIFVSEGQSVERGEGLVELGSQGRG